MVFTVNAQIFSTNKGIVSFNSHAPLEDIFAESKTLNAAINTTTKMVAAKIKINTMTFENSMQQEHFNEKYMESDKFPIGQFSGTITDDVDLTKEGVYNITAKGKLMLHGVGRDREIQLKITVSAASVSVETSFKVKVEQHKIQIPKLVFQKVAEEVEVKMEAVMLAKIKK